MPSFLEGDRKLTMEFAGHNLSLLADAVTDGFDILCSCPTCSYMLRHLLPEGAYYSHEYQESIGPDPRYIKVPVKRKLGEPQQEKIFEVSDKIIYKDILKDDGYFSSLAPLQRAMLLEKTFDLGEYLLHLHTSGQFKTDFGPVSGRAVYFPPCHQREQGFGLPYADLLRLVPGLRLEPIEGNLYCCGMGGLMGFKRDFHLASIELSRRLIQRIQELEPEILVTDCLSCRLQFRQLLSQTVVHPLEILSSAYQAGRQL
jgi:glycerol-3-phosphate dehydrogenase subunit C